MRFTSKQVTTLVVAVCAAAVFAPVAVFAATGQLVNVVDATTGKPARVSSNNALVVENRVGQGTNSFNMRGSRYQFGWIGLASTTGPTRLAITELTLSGQYEPAGVAGEVLLEAMVRTSGTQPCNGPGTPGYTRYTLKHLWVETRKTLELNFSAQALALPGAASGQPMCFGVTYYAGATNMTIYADGTGYKFS